MGHFRRMGAQLRQHARWWHGKKIMPISLSMQTLQTLCSFISFFSDCSENMNWVKRHKIKSAISTRWTPALTCVMMSSLGGFPWTWSFSEERSTGTGDPWRGAGFLFPIFFLDSGETKWCPINKYKCIIKSSNPRFFLPHYQTLKGGSNGSKRNPWREPQHN